MLKLIHPGVVAASLLLAVPVTFAQGNNPTIGSSAVVHFAFDEGNGQAKDSAKVGQSADDGKLSNDPARVASPFWNQSGKRVLQLDAGKQQAIEIPSSPDVSAPQSVSISMFCVNLTEPTDATFHGFFAKRGTTDGKLNANYGINFQMQSDAFQVYVHDGTDYRVATYSTKAAFPPRKLAHITVTYSLGTSPGQEADKNLNDVRMQYFINGEPLTPKAVTRGIVKGNEAWTQDINPAGLLNNHPLAIGKSEGNIEFTSCVIGDLRVFPRALSVEEAKALFLEVAGSNVNELIAADKPQAQKIPVIANLSQSGLQTGQTTQLIANGSDLGPGTSVVFPLPDVKFAVASESTPNRVVMNVTVPPGAVPGIYPVWVKSQSGISRPASIAIDRLPQVAVGGSPDKPATIPAAFFGSLSGGQQQIVTISGYKGQRVVADVELKRLGGAANPVIEIKSSSGSPLAIGWGQNSLRGDARTELILPATGTYSIELHDLTFNAPGASPFRMKIGDLKLIDGLIPAAAAPGTVEVEPVGSGFAQGTKFSGQFAALTDSGAGAISLPPETGFAGVLPSVPLSRGIEIPESSIGHAGAAQPVDARFQQPSVKPVAISGRISNKGESDSYLLNVTPGQRLKFTLQTDSLGSPLEGELRLLGKPQDNVLASTSDAPTGSDLNLELTVPVGLSQVEAKIRDLFGRGDSRSFYRLLIEPAGQPRFSLAINSTSINLPEDGSAIVELQVTRADYSGAIHLKIVGDPTISISPNYLPAGSAGKFMVRLRRRGANSNAVTGMVRLIGESVGLQPVVRRTARVQSNSLPATATDLMGIGMTAAANLAIESQPGPTVLFRGVSTVLGVELTRPADAAVSKLPVKLSLESDEPSRRRDRNNPASPEFPKVAILPQIMLPDESESTAVTITVPLEVSEPTIDFTIRADAVTHAYSERAVASAYSQPFRAEIKTAVAPKLDDATTSLVGEINHPLKGTVGRTVGFNGPVEVTLTGLPGDYSVQPANVAADQDQFQLIIKAPKVTAETPVANVKLRVTSAGSLLIPELPVSLKVLPGKTP